MRILCRKQCEAHAGLGVRFMLTALFRWHDEMTMFRRIFSSLSLKAKPLFVVALVFMPSAILSQRGQPARPPSAIPPFPQSAAFATVTRVAFSRDGKQGAIAWANELTLVDLGRGTERTISTAGEISALAFSPDGTELAYSRNDRSSLSPIGRPRDLFVEVTILDVRTGAVRNSWFESHISQVQALAYTTGGSLVAVGAHAIDPVTVGRSTSQFDTLSLWDVSTRMLFPIYRADKSSQLARYEAAFSPSGDMVALSVSIYSGMQSARSFTGRNNRLSLYDTKTGSLICVMDKEFTGPPRLLTFSPDGLKLAGVVENTRVRLYDIKKRKALRTIRALPFGIASLVLPADGKILVVSGAQNLPGFETPAALAESKEGTGRVFVVDPEKQTIEKRIDLARASAFNRIVPGTNLLASSSLGAVSLYDIQTGKTVGVLPAAGPRTPSAPLVMPPAPIRSEERFGLSVHRILALSFLPGGNRVIAGGNDGRIYIWDLLTGKEIERKTIAAPTDLVALSEDGKIAASEDAGKILVVNILTDTAPITLTDGGGRLSALALSSQGDLLAAGSSDGTIRVWRIGDRDPSMIWNGHKGAVHALAFARNSAQLASAGEDLLVRVWDLGSGKEIRALKGHTKKINRVVFSNDGSIVASCGDDSTVILWSVQSGTSRKLKESGTRFHALGFAPRQPVLASGSDDSLRLWDVKKGNLIRELMERLDPKRRVFSNVSSDPESVMVVSFSTDGRALACGCTNMQILVFDTSTWEIRRMKPIQPDNSR